MNRIKLILLAALFCIASGPKPTWAQTSGPAHPGAILQKLEKLNTVGTVLYVAAHPDDENTRLLSWLANERKLRTVYLSLTRGDGGQNLIGSEQGVELGMIRTRELLEARKVDGAEQAFTRCYDFGYSKTPEETFRIWNHEEALADVVWAIRLYRPDVIINRFPSTGEGGHGHHTASALLAIEAFNAAADPSRFPDQLKHVQPWQAKRIFHNSFNFRNAPASNFEGQIALDVGGYNPLLGISYGEMASESRSMHKSQGFGVARGRGVQMEYFKRLAGDTAVSEIFQNINTSWSRAKNGKELEMLIRKTILSFNSNKPENSLADLFLILQKIRSLDDPYWREVKEKEVMQLISDCAGLWIEANATNYYATGEAIVELNLSVLSRLAGDMKLDRIRVHLTDSTTNLPLEINKPVMIRTALQLPYDAPLSTPFWLENPVHGGLFKVPSNAMVHQPWNDDYLKVTFTLSRKGTEISYTIPVNYKWTDPVRGEVYRPFEILPKLSVTPVSDLLLFTSQQPQTASFRLLCLSESVKETLRVKVPDGWRIEPAEMRVSLSGMRKDTLIHFNVFPPPPSDDRMAGLQPEMSLMLEKDPAVSVRRIEYNHIPNLVSLRESRIKLITLSMSTAVRKIGYIEGAGDEVARCLRQAGYEVEVLSSERILNTSLSEFGAIITGIRAYNTKDEMESFYKPLMTYVEEGGNLIVQYNTNNFISSLKSDIGPFPFKITRNRVTDEQAPVTFVNPSHAVLNRPNKISATDFEHWVQERGLYFAGEPAPEYENILRWNDPGEQPQDGALIIARKGKGHFIYTGISFFRQLPAGVPGAYRLLSNLINLGK